MKRIIVGVVIAVIFVTSLFYFLNSRQVKNITQSVTGQLGMSSPTPSPDPFDSLTIPYLRDREYVSQLGELKKYQENSTHTSYLTSYDSDGYRVNGLLTIPKSEGRHPAIVFVHGYIAPNVYKTTERYGDYVNYLARNGYVVFKIDLRGNGSSEGVPTGAYYSGDYVIDTLNAYAALTNADFVDPQKIGLWGHSMAGNVVFRAMIAKQTIPAVVVWAGAGYTYDDLRQYRIMDRSYRPPTSDNEAAKRRSRLRELHGEFDPNDEFWRKIVPTSYLDGVEGAIQLNHAVDDNVVSVEYSRNLVNKLQGTSIISELKEYPTGGHNLEGSTFSQAMKNTVDFFGRYLGEK